jgi:hypothetical protein
MGCRMGEKMRQLIFFSMEIDARSNVNCSLGCALMIRGIIIFDITNLNNLGVR